MSSLANAGAVLAGLAIGGAGGWRLGGAARGNSARYWTFNALAVAVGMALDFAGLLQGWQWLGLGALGLMAGALTGLRFGYSDTLGKMRPVERDEAGADAEQPEPVPENEFTPRHVDS